MRASLSQPEWAQRGLRYLEVSLESAFGVDTCAPFLAAKNGQRDFFFFSLVSSLKLIAEMDGMVPSALLTTRLSRYEQRVSASAALPQPISVPFAYYVWVTADAQQQPELDTLLAAPTLMQMSATE